MPLENLRVGLTNLIKRPRVAVEGLVEKIKRQEFRVPQIRLPNLINTQGTALPKETALRIAPTLRKIGEKVAGIGEKVTTPRAGESRALTATRSTLGLARIPTTFLC